MVFFVCHIRVIFLACQQPDTCLPFITLWSMLHNQTLPWFLSLTKNQHVGKKRHPKEPAPFKLQSPEFIYFGNFTAKCSAPATPGFFHLFDQHYKLFEKNIFLSQPLIIIIIINEYPPCPRTMGHKAHSEPGRIRTVTSVSEIFCVDLKFSSQPWKYTVDAGKHTTRSTQHL